MILQPFRGVTTLDAGNSDNSVERKSGHYTRFWNFTEKSELLIDNPIGQQLARRVLSPLKSLLANC